MTTGNLQTLALARKLHRSAVTTAPPEVEPFWNADDQSIIKSTENSLQGFDTMLITHNENETAAAGEKLAKELKPGDVVAMYGDLGAGKTAFVRGMAKGLGLPVRVSSPTFTIVNEYIGKVPLFHFDMYRLKDSDELFEIGWEDYLERGGICAVEWSENVEDAFSESVIRVKIDKLSETDREIDITMPK